MLSPVYGIGLATNLLSLISYLTLSNVIYPSSYIVRIISAILFSGNIGFRSLRVRSKSETSSLSEPANLNTYGKRLSLRVSTPCLLNAAYSLAYYVGLYPGTVRSNDLSVYCIS